MNEDEAPKFVADGPGDAPPARCVIFFSHGDGRNPDEDFMSTESPSKEPRRGSVPSLRAPLSDAAAYGSAQLSLWWQDGIYIRK